MTLDLSNAIPDALIVADTSGNVVRVNARAEKMFGYSSDEFLSLSISDLLASRCRKQIARRIKAFSSTKRRSSRLPDENLIAVTASGTEMPVEICLSKLTDDGIAYLCAVVRDVTATNRLNTKLAQNQARFRIFSKFSVEWHWKQDANLRFVDVSDDDSESHLDRLRNIRGKTRTELDYVWESPDAFAEHERVTREHKPFRNVLLHNPGNDRFALVSGEPLFDEHGEFLGYEGIGRNITAEKHAERALRESEGRFRSLTALSSDWFWKSDAQHRFTFMYGDNKSTQLYEESNVLGKTRFELPYIWESDQVREEHKQVLAEHKVFRNLLLHNPANDRFALTSGEPLFDREGVFLGYQGVSRDVTAEKRSERALRSSEQRFRTLTGMSYDWHWEQDADLRFTVMSGVTDKTHLAAVEQVKGRTRFDLNYEWESEVAREEHERVLAERKPFSDLLLHNPSNDRFALISGEPVFDEHGVFSGYQGVSRDVTTEKRTERAMRESEARFRALTALSADWYWEQGPDLRFTYISGVNDDTHLTTIEKVLGKTRLELPYNWESDLARAEHQRILAARKPFRDLLLHNPENDRFALITGEPIFDANDEFRGYQGVSRDITREKHSERAVRDSESRFRALTALSSDWYWEQDENCRFIYFSSTATRNAKLDINSIIGRTRFELPIVWESPAEKQKHRETLDSYLPFRDLLVSTQSGDQYTLVSGEPVFAEDNTFKGYRGIAKDVTAQRLAEAEALRLATYDPLTGLPNRTMLIEQINRAIHQAKRNKSCVAVLFVDLDRFKTLNDSLGHGAGDELLHHLAERLNSQLRMTDTLCRFGGDEFVVVLEEVNNVTQIEKIATKILRALSEPVDLQDVSYQTTASLGISLYPDDASDVEKLLRNADLAMYEAKATGGDRFRFYAEEMNRRVAARAKLDRELRLAINREEFDVYLQPQYDIASGQVVAAEVLLRWHHPELGVVAPGTFLDVAEEGGLIVPIGHIVIERTFEIIADWLRAGITPPRIAINISSRQLLEGDALLSRVRSLFNMTAVPSDMIEFEITESLLIPHEDDMVSSILDTFGQMGIRLSIDDFGTGYSSLSYLKRLPVNAVKIDRSFVSDLETNDESLAIVRAVVGIARSMKLDVVTEGVETEGQLEIVKDAGCDTYQGFLRAKPMPRCEFEEAFLGIQNSKKQRCHPLCGCSHINPSRSGAGRLKLVKSDESSADKRRFGNDA